MGRKFIGFVWLIEMIMGISEVLLEIEFLGEYFGELWNFLLRVLV